MADKIMIPLKDRYKCPNPDCNSKTSPTHEFHDSYKKFYLDHYCQTCGSGVRFEFDMTLIETTIEIDNLHKERTGVSKRANNQPCWL